MSRKACFAVILLGVLARPAAAQDPASPPPAPLPTPAARPAPSSEGVPVPLQVDVVVERHHDKRLVARLPTRFVLNAGFTGDGAHTAVVRVGIEVPLAAAPGSAATTFRNVGLDLSCRVRTAGGFYVLNLSLQSTGLHEAAGEEREAPLLNTLNVTLNPSLRDGQTVQALSSTNPVTGEVTTVDVTLKVLK